MVSSESKKRRRKEGQRRKKAARVEVPLLKEEKEEEKDVEVVIVGLDEDDAEYEHFKDVFSKMQPKEGEDAESDDDASSEDEVMKEEKAQLKEGEAQKAGLSKKEQRQCKRFTVAQLKQVVSDPGVVEYHDTNSPDPRLLVLLKAYRNTVPIPRHWCHKRKYLSRKRGGAKPPFELPANIAATGVDRIREAYLKQEDERRERKLSADKTRVKVQRIDQDFMVLQNAFHRKNLVVPPLLRYGEMFYEGIESELKYKKMRPGVLSDKLKRALGLPDDNYPPPWLTNMQKYGPPRSYPVLKVPGLTHPIPAGAAYGFGPGQWGKVPVDPDTGKPLYGNVFAADQQQAEPELWGQILSDEEEEDEYMDDVAAPQPDDDAVEGAGAASVVPMSEDDMTEAGGAAASMASRITPSDAPDILDLRKAPASSAPQQAYQVLEQVAVAPVAGSLAPSYGYNLGKKDEEVSFSLTDAELERLQSGDTSVIKNRYEAHEAAANRANANISNSFAEEADARRGAAGKKKKEFKF
eukprot:TRINITY_DN4233_c0_g2_i1.p1 TRINITY_DN4233_c0_g2~~TRINITY_DN4233_c0_g2_i1.p1  ORF type:complete len:540 (+),score=258.55 TRINITY_DN4233_c0_g2_i1:57-1622(+)